VEVVVEGVIILLVQGDRAVVGLEQQGLQTVDTVLLTQVQVEVILKEVLTLLAMEVLELLF
jgi:hypothetical protein